MKKRYRVTNPVRFIATILLFIFLVFLFMSKENKNVYANDEVIVRELEQFIKDFSVISEEIREQMENNKTEKEAEEFTLLNISLSEELQRHTYDTCKKYNMDYIFVLAVFATESEYRSGVKSKNQVGNGYSVGIGQLNQNYIKWYKELTGIKKFDINNDKHNIEGSIAVLKFYRDYWKNNVEEMSEEDLWYFTLNSYNMGIEGFKKYIRNTGETSRHYDRKVLENKIKLEQDGGI